jgi:hypothetical protein
MIDTDRNYIVEAQMILKGLTNMLVEKRHLEALDEHYQVLLINIANDMEQVKRKVLNG